MDNHRRLVWAAIGFLAASGTAFAETPVERRLRVLEEQLQQAQQEIIRLRRQVEEQKTTGEVARKQTQDQVAETQKLVPDWLKRTAVFGDVRFRHEGFYHQPARDEQKVTARNRERIRARLGVKSTFSDELSATIRIASGSPDDPISTNQTLGESFTPKDINLDWAYITFNPAATFGIRPGLLSMNAGKFPSPLFRPSELLFDDDLSPEGFSETVALLSKPMGALQQIKVHGLQWTFNEVSNGEDSWVFGGQINPSLRLLGADVELGVGHYWFLNDDAIAVDMNDNSDLKKTNLLITSDDDIVGFQSAFNLTHVGANVTFPNVVGTMPLRFSTEFVHNWEAVNAEDNGYLGGVRLGQTRVQGDWAVGGFYERLEQEAALGTFSASDFGLGGTNNEGAWLQLDYQLLNPITLTARNYFVNFIDRPAGLSNPTLFRLQLDAMLRF